MAFGPDGRLLATGSDDGSARVWDPATGGSVPALTGHTDRVHGVAFGPDGRLLATADGDRTARVWDPLAGTRRSRIGHFAGRRGGVHPGRAAAGHRRAPGRCGCGVRPPAAPPQALTGHTNWVYGVAFGPDGRLLATTSGDGSVRVWDPPTGGTAATLTGHSDRVAGVAFGPDGRLLATADGDRTVRVWDPPTGEHRRTLTGHTSSVRGVAFSPDGRLLATASDDKTVRVWD